MADTINSKYCIGGFKNIGVVCQFEYAASLIEELIRMGHSVFDVELRNPEMDGYTYEYVVSLNGDGIWAEPLYKPDKDGNMRYLEFEADIAYVHQDCNSKVLDSIFADKIYEYSVAEYDEEEEETEGENDTCAHCEWAEGCRDKYKSEPDVFDSLWKVANDILDIFGL